MPENSGKVSDKKKTETANHMQWRHQKFLERGTFFIGQKMKDQKLGSGLARNQDFAKEERLETQVQKFYK